MPSTTDLTSILADEQDALAAETRLSKVPPYVAVHDMGQVATTPSIFRNDHPATVRPLANARGGSMIVDWPSLSSKALWIDLNADKHDNYYKTDYVLFLNTEYQLGMDNIPETFDVDHLYNEARARNYGLRYVRLALVHYRVNRSHGSGPEKDVTRNEELRSPGRPKQMEELISMKYFGFLPPLRSDPRDQEVQAYAAFAQSKLGLDPDAVRDSIRYLRKKASTPWARKTSK